MFDFRYHVVSLAAVFIALVIGILVGVGISGSGLVEARERGLLNRQIEDLQRDVDRAGERIAELEDSQRSAQEFVDRSYPVLMEERLAERRIAVLYVGGVDSGMRANVELALAHAGAPEVLRLRAVKVPIEPDTLDAALLQRPAFARFAGEEGLGDLGRELGQEFVLGGETPLWELLEPDLVVEQDGSDRPPADGVVVVRSTEPQQGPTARFLAGLYRGLAAAGVPAVGVETSSTNVSAVPAWKRAGLSVVDDVEAASGRLALALLLAGAEPGHYGVKSGARSVLPPIEPVPAPGG